MSLSDRRNFLLVLGALPLAACGFTPVYQQGGAATGLTGNIRFNLIDSREGFLLLSALESRLGTASANAPFQAVVTLTLTNRDLTLNAATALQRHDLAATAEISVTNAAGETVFSNVVRDATSYSTSTQNLANMTSRDAATARLMQALADKIVRQLAVTSESWAK